MRSALKDILVDDIRTDRVKKGFNCSIKTLIDFQNKDVINYLFDSKSKIFDYVNIDEFKKILNEDLKKNHFSKFIFVFLSTKIFLDKY